MEGLERLRPLLKSFVEKGPAGCALTVTHHGEQLFEEYVGLADVESNRSIGPETIYRIFSMTKIVTCTAALMLYERGLFLLDDPLEEYLPEFKNAQVYRRDKEGGIYTTPSTRPILIKDLFTMTSGLTYGGRNDETEIQVQKVLASGEGMTLRNMSKTLASIPLAFDPGTEWRYSFSHDVLGALIEVVSGKTLGQFFKDEIFDPLDMKDTFHRIPQDRVERLCSLYNYTTSGLTKNIAFDRDHQSDASFEGGGSGLLSTIGDYSKFAHMLANGGELNGVRILGKNTIQLMATNHLSSEQLTNYNWPFLSGYGYGLGVRVMMDPTVAGINSTLGEFGWCGLAGTWVLIDTKEKLSAVYMQQMMPNFEAYHQPRIRNVIYGAL
ncbi:class A beta-lactamase-related serine hydrolase [Anaerobacillus alkaliphilus]|uniref:Class A beta-lactamase-related serine hydrolase n=1 Tax=Anaerobacillus alkaliphilus TaxID=1548597 RepID=A0A4Q0VNE1_9BACI|nr:serine hydrolase domain-containing protein [Anaerobacillus alkaliphilus]RXI96332.1 class A beta-lactamase-related serine hydrolase [Anaerobacillus alkaliphilus]